MNYLIGLKNGYHRLGNTGTLITHYKAPYKLKETALYFATMYKHDAVYLLEEYPQRLSEMNSDDFVKHIRTNCKRLA